MFLSFRLSDAETRYSNPERECLAVVKCLAEVRWMVMGSKFPVTIYSDVGTVDAATREGQEKHRHTLC